MTGTNVQSTSLVLAIAAALIALCLSAGGQTLAVVHNFTGAVGDGAYPYDAGLLALGGKLYGVTSGGGRRGAGTFYELTLQSNGTWELSVLYSFTGGDPIGSVIADTAGNFYGITNGGGLHGAGTAYRLSNTSGTWQKTTLWSFGGPRDGAYPSAGLVLDQSGNLYGTTVLGGIYGEGAAFELSPSAGEMYTETLLHSFGAGASDGEHPNAPLIIDAAGNLFGTTSIGGSTTCSLETLSCGTVFELSPGANGWTETVIHYFEANGTDGFFPLSPLMMDKEGNLYGTTEDGGSGGDRCDSGGGTTGCGTVFVLSRSPSGHWEEQIIHAFGGGDAGSEPNSGLVTDSAGNIYGETAPTEQFQGDGAVYELARSSSGVWEFEIRVTFNGTNGNSPQGGLVLAQDRLFGTTNAGGASGEGDVFALAP